MRIEFNEIRPGDLIRGYDDKDTRLIIAVIVGPDTNRMVIHQLTTTGYVIYVAIAMGHWDAMCRAGK